MTRKSVRDQLWEAADPDGSQRALLDVAALAGRAPTWLQRLGRSVDASWTRLADLGKEQTALMDLIEAAVRGEFRLLAFFDPSTPEPVHEMRRSLIQQLPGGAVATL